MLRIEKETKDDKEVTTIGIELPPTQLKTGTVAGALVGWLFAGLPGILFGGIVGEVASNIHQEKKD